MTDIKPQRNITWWRHQMETFSALLAIFAGNSPVPGEFPHKGQWRGALMLSLICVWINAWVNNREAGDLRRHRAHYDVIVMTKSKPCDISWCVLCIALFHSAQIFITHTDRWWWALENILQWMIFLFWNFKILVSPEAASVCKYYYLVPKKVILYFRSWVHLWQ